MADNTGPHSIRAGAMLQSREIVISSCLSSGGPGRCWRPELGYDSCLEEELEPDKVWSLRLMLEGIGSLMGLSKVGIRPSSGRGLGASLSS